MNGHQKHSKLVKTITSKHYFTLTPIFCRKGKWVHQNPITSKHYVTLSKNFKPNQAESVRDKKGWVSFQNLMSGFFDVMV